MGLEFPEAVGERGGLLARPAQPRISSDSAVVNDEIKIRTLVA
jgi:hypothetical protein